MKKPASQPSPFQPSWRLRRRMVFWTLLYCAVLVAYCAVAGGDSRVRETIAYACTALAAVVVLGYLGFPVLQDNSLAKLFARQQESSWGGGGWGGWDGGAGGHGLNPGERPYTGDDHA